MVRDWSSLLLGVGVVVLIRAEIWYAAESSQGFVSSEQSRRIFQREMLNTYSSRYETIVPTRVGTKPSYLLE